MMKRWYLFPFSIIYHIITSIRNRAFNIGLLKSNQIPIHTIGVGNLSVGGTGKSPVVMYLSQLLANKKRLGVLSRGYGRISKGYKLLNYTTYFEQVGDEAMQLFHRLRNKVVIVVCENRVFGAKKMINDLDINCLILDDNMQHRYLKAGLQIMLTEYKDPFFKDFLLPAGDLRESRHGMKRADIIIVTKCPDEITEEKKIFYINKIKPKKHQHVFFGAIDYHDKIISKNNEIPVQNLEYYEVLLITGIANSHYFYEEVRKNCHNIKHKKYSDHHNFSNEDKQDILNLYKKMGDYKLLLCSEKDYVRLNHIDFFKESLYYWPINIKIDKKQQFNQLILDYVE